MHSEISEMQRQVWKRDAENNKRAHLRVTLSLGFLMSFEEAVKSSKCEPGGCLTMLL